MRSQPDQGIIADMQIIPFARPLVLATASEARRALVAATGIPHTLLTVEIDETPLPGEAVDAYVRRLAIAKAEAALPSALDAVVVAVDTAVGFEGRIIGKPRDEQHAAEILQALAGKTHEVVSAIALRDLMLAEVRCEVTRTEVEFAPMPEPCVRWYLQTGEWKGRAGAYAIQGKGAVLVAAVRGCLTNVVGISMPVLLRMLGAVQR